MKKIFCIALSLLVASSIFLSACDTNASNGMDVSGSEQLNQSSRPENSDNQHQHKYSEKVTAPTCTQQGFTTHTCSVCGDSYTDNYTKETGHQIEEDKCVKCGIYDVLEVYVFSVYDDVYVESENSFMFAIEFHNSEDDIVSTDGKLSVLIKINDEEVYQCEKNISKADFEMQDIGSDTDVPLFPLSIPADTIIEPENIIPSGTITFTFEGGNNINNAHNQYEHTFKLSFPYQKKLSYITDRTVTTDNDGYTVIFGLLDQDKKYITSDVSVAVRIVNDSSQTVYNKTYTVSSSDFYSYQDKLLVNVKIPKNAIIAGATKTGKLYYKVYNEGGSFNEMSYSLSDLPYEKIVTYITDRNVTENDDCYTITFGFLDQEEEYIASDASVEVRIVNEEEQTVLNKTFIVLSSDFYSYQGKLLVDIKVSKNEIIAGATKNGNLYYRVFDEKGSFNEYSYSLNDLPSNKWSYSEVIDLNEGAKKASENAQKAFEYAINAMTASYIYKVLYNQYAVDYIKIVKGYLASIKAIADRKVDLPLTNTDGKYSTLQEKINYAYELCDEIVDLQITTSNYTTYESVILDTTQEVSLECLGIQKLSVDLLGLFVS